jgi:hypothetical protein
VTDGTLNAQVLCEVNGKTFWSTLGDEAGGLQANVAKLPELLRALKSDARFLNELSQLKLCEVSQLSRRHE